jgi:hypothetical protein
MINRNSDHGPLTGSQVGSKTKGMMGAIRIEYVYLQPPPMDQPQLLVVAHFVKRGVRSRQEQPVARSAVCITMGFHILVGTTGVIKPIVGRNKLIDCHSFLLSPAPLAVLWVPL